jgi:hypothetical protein
VSPAIHVRTRRFFLTLARRECQLETTGRGCLLGNRGALPLQGAPHGAPSGALAGSQGLTARGLPSGTRVRRLLAPVRTSRSATHSPFHTDRSSWDFLFALPRPPGRRTTLLQHARRRSDRASWISAPNRASFQAPIAAAQGVGSRTPRLGSDAAG